ncbi:MAG TPA: indolepyruvate ferredoxin oxidoreductase subunit beta [Methanothrix sp.]|nr:indolepyruvate ferredoxin oxidoreductase subunit beta [Methanothrix sp.]HOK57996.1 indolepyruvate ferredoxin oxidoreductase subunit beta [Methanothrix sp.]HOL43399.1 indolepyruvate ferredoxin oxidoreductase subunit beta [Methanothrix sp.]HPO88402.1 indolepyruvate ferredoxin oxidoreductase subunit beta [Methanothrix sp.]
MRTSKCDIVIVGVGGQGVILISEIIGRAALRAGIPVRAAETHGMAQRGGSVINHTRLGCVYGPMVPEGGADILLALEPAEVLRYGRYLSRGGVALVNTKPVLPTTVTTGQFRYPDIEEILAPLRGVARVIAMNATEIAERAGNPQTTNIVMLGAMSRFMPIEEALILDALRDSVPGKYIDVNMRAFELGKAEVSG